MCSKRVVVLLAAVLAAGSAWGQTLNRGPFIQNPDALTTTMTVEWWTDVAGNSTVEYGTTPALGSSVTIAQAASCEIGSAGTCHVVPLTGLLPGTRYYYRLLTNGTQVLATTYFQTMRAPGDPADVFFTVFGDWGANSGSEANVANNQNATDPPLVLTVGDNAYQNGTQSDWDNNALIPQYENNLLRRALFMTTLGNHDLNNVGASNWQNSVEIKMFLNPRNAPSGQEERFYSFDYGDAHFVVMDANQPTSGGQVSWLASDLAATTRKWKFVFLHQTPYSCATGPASIGSNSTVRNNWGPLFEQYGVDIVFDGHDHIYERTKLVDDYMIGGASGSDGLSTRYIMTGGGGQTLDSACGVDSNGAYGQQLFGPKVYCPWLANDCANGVNGQYCSFALFHHTEVRITSNNTLTIRAIDQNNNVFDTFTVTKGATCGNSIVEAGEQCDQGANNGAAGSCCTAGCQFVGSGTACRASAGICDLAESCTGSSGTCPTNAFVSTGTPCRASAGICDVAESCTGSSAACPSNGFVSGGTPCRASAGACDPAESCDGIGDACPADQKSSGVCRASAGVCDPAESCDGVGNACPADQKSSALCRPAAGTCDVAESCDGSNDACPADDFVTGGTPCRASAGPCDVAETCPGTGPACPGDVVVASGVTCRASAGECDVAEACDGSSAACPADGFVASGTGCRASAGICDPAESCSGSSPSCPADGKSTAVCRASAGPCDSAETCDGSSDACPADGFASAGTTCRAAAGVCDVAETCSGSSAACPADTLVGAGTVCRSAAGICDTAETCNGSSATCPADGLAASGTVCRASAGVCDPAETCSGSSPSCPSDAKSAAICRAAAGVCDVAEQCDGVSNSCPANGFVGAGTVCRAAVGGCDVAETCSGAGAACPANGFAGAGTVCRAAAGSCDVAETCSGSTAACAADGLVAAGTVCRASGGVCDPAESCSGSSPACPSDGKSTAVCRPAAGPCDAAESCDGVSNGCPGNGFVAAGTVCRAAAGVCDLAETCSGSSAGCPADAKSTAVCRPALGICDVAESCDGVGDACPADQVAAAGLECRASTGACDIAEVCDGTSGTCPPDVGQADTDGDGVCDAEDDCPTAADPGQEDGDGDGLGDACDPCTNGAPVALAKLNASKLGPPPGDDRLSFKGQMTFPFPFNPTFYPPSKGARVLLADASGAQIVDAFLPPGFYDFNTLTGWVGGGGGTWTFKHPTGIQGIIKLVLKPNKTILGLIKFRVVGKYGTFALTPQSFPVKGTVVVDAPRATTGQCGEIVFPGVPGPLCSFNTSATSFRCK